MLAAPTKEKAVSSITPFVFESHSIRTITDSDGNALFCGRDVAIALGYRDPNDALKAHCKGPAIHRSLQTAGGLQQTRVIAEPDVLRLIVSSKLPAAERFERWVFEDVLPAIRRTGSYGVAAPKSMIEALELALDQARKIEAQNAIIAEQAVSVVALDRITKSDGRLCPRDAAKVLKIAPMKLLEWMDANDWTFIQNGNRHAYQARIKAGDMVQHIHEYAEGKSRAQVYITPKGVVKLAKRLSGGEQQELIPS